MEQTLFVTRDKDGIVKLWHSKPQRVSIPTNIPYDDAKILWKFGGDYIQLGVSSFPDQKWEDEPKEVTLVSIISEVELDKLAKKNIPQYYDEDDEWIVPYVFGFKVGYRKAKEE